MKKTLWLLGHFFNIFSMVWVIGQTMPKHPHGFHLFLLFVLALFTADAISGLVHFTGDFPKKWQSPFLQKFHASSLRHHEFPRALVQEGILGLEMLQPFYYVLFVLLSGFFFLKAELFYMAVWFYASLFFSWLTMALHVELHKSKKNFVVRLCQKLKLIIHEQYHFIHHQPPHDKNFCALNGWAEPFLVHLRIYKLWGLFLKWLPL